jgi:uncharacterized membrane protein YdjX (TVP38/TMEM64 family)
MDDQAKTGSRAKASLLRPAAMIAIVVGVMFAAWYFNLGEQIKAVQNWIGTLGAWGPVVFVIVYAVAAVAALPGVVLTVGAGGLFGSVMGTIAVSLGSTLGAALAFLVARYFARSSVESWLNKNQKFRKLDHMTQDFGSIMVAITRLVPIFPFNLLNYGFGLTKVSFVTYVFYSWLCMLPMTVVYVVGSDAVFTAVREGRVPWALVVVVVSVMLMLALIVRQAKKKLDAGKTSLTDNQA